MRRQRSPHRGGARPLQLGAAHAAPSSTTPQRASTRALWPVNGGTRSTAATAAAVARKLADGTHAAGSPLLGQRRDSDGHADGRVWSSRRVEALRIGSNPPRCPLSPAPPQSVFRRCAAIFAPRVSVVWAGAPTLTTPALHGSACAQHDPPLRAVRSAMSPGAGGRCIPPVTSLTATNLVKAPCASAYSNTRRYEPVGRCVAPRCLSVPVSIDIAILPRACLLSGLGHRL